MCSSSYDSKRSDSTTEESNNAESASSSCSNERFVFPAAPRLCKSASPCSVSCRSDSSVSDSKLVRARRRSRRKSVRTLPPVGVFWDIENCQVPRTKSATSVVQRIRELFYWDYREAEFVVVCDVKKESQQVILDLNDAQVNLIHVASTSKNAADEKLRQSLRRFAEIHKAPAAVALISSDINFASDLSDLRYRKKIHVILIHNNNVADALILCASETYSFASITGTIPSTLKNKAVGTHQADLYIHNLPVINDSGRLRTLKSRLKLLSDNCGGRVLNVESGTAVIRFSSLDFAKRAQKRLEGEDVFGSKIRVSNPALVRESPFKNCAGRKARNSDVLHQVPPFPVPQAYGQPVLGTSFYSGTGGRSLCAVDFDQELLNANAQRFRPIRGTGFMDVPYHHQSFNMSESAPSAAAAIALPLKANLSNCSFSDSVSDPRVTNKSAVVGSLPIELVVSNLDSSIDIKDLRSILLNMLKQYAMVLNLTVSIQTDGSPVANVKVGSQQEAQFVISQLHHQWLGSKRMAISYSQANSDPDQLRFMIIALLQEVPGNRMPLFTFLELVGSRYRCTISLSEVNKLKDVCKITEGHSGRMITLTPEASISSPVHMANSFALYCTVHCPHGLENRGWGEAEDVALPNIKISLKLFATKVNRLLVSHMGCIPLLSFPVCYAVEFGQPLPEDETGVPLEHLVSCISNVELTYCGQNKNVKYLKLKDTKEKAKEPEDVLVKSVSPSLMTNITMLCREVVDLLKTADRCQLLMSRYIPAYHHHFGRQCRVADYGFTRLIELFEAISHVVQILGSGAKRTITLTHAAQMRRFTSDLLRVLKGQVSKLVTVTDFPAAYDKVLRKAFNPVEYGLCSLDDLLDEVAENTVIISSVNNMVTIAIPKREQTVEEIQRTKQFASEVIELLRHSPYCSILFNKFVPAYHHHFGRQCKVSDYGFTKLAELFEAIPETVEVEGASDVDRKVKLKLPLALKVLGTKIQMLIKESKLAAVHVDILSNVYKRVYGYTLKPQAYECRDFAELICRLIDFVQVVHGSAGPQLVLTDTDTRILEVRVWALLMNPPHTCSIVKFIHDYRVRFFSTLPITKLEQLQNVVELQISNDGTETIVSLTKCYRLAAQLYHLLMSSGGHMQLNSITNVYFRKFGKSLSVTDYGANSLEGLLRQMSFLVILKGSGKKTNVSLNKDLAACGISLPPPIAESLQWPPPATHNLITNLRGITPPKPDTPPAQSIWNNSIWHTPPKNDSTLYLSIPLPSADAPKVLNNMEGLISPTRGLLCASSHPLNSSLNPVIPKITAPHPAVLPLPDKLITKDDSSDSGVNSSRVEYTLSDNEMYLGENTHALDMPPRLGKFTKTFSTFSM